MIKVINKYEFSSKLISKNEIINIINDEMIDDKEEYLVMKAISTQDKQKINPSLSDKISSIPRYVATPLPPLNFNQTGNICPRNAARPDKKIKFGK